jgi:hypothetical protein
VQTPLLFYLSAMLTGDSEMEETAEQKAAREAAEAEAKRKAEEEDEKSGEKELTVDELKAKLAESEKLRKQVNHESAERRKKLEALEEAETKRKQAEMTEVEKATAKAKAVEEEKEKLAKEVQTLKLQRSFEDKVRDAKLEFKNSLAAKDAFNALVELMGEDTEITDEHIKTLSKDRDYLFGKVDPNNQNNDASKKGKANSTILTQELVNQKRNMVGPL